MDDNGHRENGRHKPDHYKSIHAQWMMPQHHQMKDGYTMKLMAVMSERDGALQERNKALAEKREALADRDKAYIQRDAAIAERDNAILERNKALATLEALEYARETSVMNGNGGQGCPPGCNATLGTKQIHHHQHQHQQQQHLLHTRQAPPQLSDAPYDHVREMHISDAFPLSAVSESAARVRRVKRPKKDAKAPAVSMKTVKSRRKKSKMGEDGGCGDDVKMKNEWKDQDLGLNQVTFDDSMMPAPVCSCTREFRQCYKWGNGGWQSACCTTTLSEYPLPVMANKRHARMGGRKMSGSAFTKLLSRLAAEGHDLSMPLDLKDHWAKHGTNRYITIK